MCGELQVEPLLLGKKSKESYTGSSSSNRTSNAFSEGPDLKRVFEGESKFVPDRRLGMKTLAKIHLITLDSLQSIAPAGMPWLPR